MTWTDLAANVGTGTAVAGLRAARKHLSKRQYKRLLATAVAEILELHPDIGRKKARRRARRITGARPSKKLLRTTDGLDWKTGAEGVVAAAATAGVAKVASAFGSKLKEKLSAGEEEAPKEHDRVEEGDDQYYGHSGVRH